MITCKTRVLLYIILLFQHTHFSALYVFPCLFIFSVTENKLFCLCSQNYFVWEYSKNLKNSTCNFHDPKTCTINFLPKKKFLANLGIIIILFLNALNLAGAFQKVLFIKIKKIFVLFLKKNFCHSFSNYTLYEINLYKN